MKSIKIAIVHLKTRALNFFKKEEKIGEAKSKWNELAKKDANYYILTDKSVSSSEENYKHSGEKHVEDYFLHDEIIRSIIGYDKKSKVLEIGCGNGRLSEFIAPHVETLYGVDISEEMILRARARLGHQKNIIFSATDGMSFPLENGSIDAVFSFIVFQHMPSVEIIRRNIEEIARVLKPGGIAKIQLRGVPVKKNNWYYGPSFTKSGVGDLVNGTSLKIVKLDGEGERYFWAWLKKS